MFNTILEQLKHPVTLFIDRSEKEDLKKGGIKLAILSAILAFINIISEIILTFKLYNKDKFPYNNYTSSELWDVRWNAIKNAELFEGFIKNFVIMAIIIAFFAGILFIIAKLVKSPKEYSNTLSMVNSFMNLYTIGYIIYVILSLIYLPLGLLVLYATVLYSTLSLINAFRDTLELENTDILVVTTTIVLVAIIVLIAVLISIFSGESISDFMDITSLF